MATQGELFPLSEEEVGPEIYPSPLFKRPEKSLKIANVQIEGLKGFDSSSIDLAPLTLLTGPNNSGKSTVLQAIALGFDCIRRLIDIGSWRFRETGRVVSEFEFLPVNQPKDLWFKQIWKPSRDQERRIRVEIRFNDGIIIGTRIRYMYGFLNIGLDRIEPAPTQEIVRRIANNLPVMIPASPGPDAHEARLPLAHIHRSLSVRQPHRIIRNMLLELQRDDKEQEIDFLNEVCQRYFGVSLHRLAYNDDIDLEIRAPVVESDYAVDLISEGAGFNQVLQLALIVAWRKPSLLLLDEPDAHLHSSLQSQLMDFLLELVDSHDIQVILSTHSRDLIARAPLEAIVPIDRSRAAMTTLNSIEHLLLEYRRYGDISNVDIALLYQTKRCLFVEGPSDVELLRRLSSRLNYHLFAGSRQIVAFEFRGVDNIRSIPNLVDLFGRVVGQSLTWAVLRDGDANVPEIKDKLRRKAEEAGIPGFHLWSRYSIENYLIEPAYLAGALAKKRPKELSEEVVRTLLNEVIESVTDAVYALYTAKAQTVYRQMEISERPQEDGARAASQYLRSLTTLDDKIGAYPGKQVFGLFVQKLQNDYGVSLRIEEVIDEIDGATLNSEVRSLFDALSAM